jgi:hypothetical protein
MKSIKNNNISPPDGTSKNDKSYSFTRFDNHPSGYVVEMVSPYAVQTQWSNIYALTPAEKYGKSTYKVMKSLGISEEKLKVLETRKVISYKWSNEYLPS